MRPSTQTLVIGFLIVLLVCGHLIKPATNYLMLPIGRILAFGASAYVGVTVSPAIGLLMALVCLQAMREYYVIEHFTAAAMAGADCACPPGFPEFDAELKICRNADKTKSVKPTMCKCPSGYAYDTVSGICKQNSVMSSPLEVTAPSAENGGAPRPAPPASSAAPLKLELTQEEKNASLGKLSPETVAAPAPAA